MIRDTPQGKQPDSAPLFEYLGDNPVGHRHDDLAVAFVEQALADRKAIAIQTETLRLTVDGLEKIHGVVRGEVVKVRELELTMRALLTVVAALAVWMAAR